jgi:hypothetical protein
MIINAAARVVARPGPTFPRRDRHRNAAEAIPATLIGTGLIGGSMKQRGGYLVLAACGAARGLDRRRVMRCALLRKAYVQDGSVVTARRPPRSRDKRTVVAPRAALRDPGRYPAPPITNFLSASSTPSSVAPQSP